MMTIQYISNLASVLSEIRNLYKNYRLIDLLVCTLLGSEDATEVTQVG